MNSRESFIVEAPAGSGKTALLVKRFLRLLEENPPESILAITFTRKAAAEMRERIEAALTLKPDHLNIMTIDAFCYRIASQFPLEAGLLGREMLEDEDSLCEDLLQSLLEVIETGEAGATDLLKLFQYFDNQLPETVARLLDLLKNREEWLPLVLQAKTEGMATVDLLYEGLGDVKEIKSLIPQLFTQKLELRKRVDPALVGLQHSLLEDQDLLDRYLHIAHLPDPDFRSDPILDVLLRVLPVIAAHLKIVLAERNETDYHEIALAALSVLEDPTETVLANLDGKISHILVDEFQDTSNLQFQLLKLLTADWQQGDGRTLFLVGDPKQSIYRFRNAEVGLFLEAKHKGIGRLQLTPWQLTQNFRTESKLLDWINERCSRFFPKKEDERLGRVPYLKSQAAKQGNSGQAIEKNCVDEEEEAVWIVKQIKALPLTERIAILVRARSHYQAIINALDAQGLEYSVADDRRWIDSSLVDDLISLLYAINHPQDRLSWCALFRSPFFGFSLSKIMQILESGEPFSQYLDIPKDEDLYVRFCQALAVLNQEQSHPVIDQFLMFLLTLDRLPSQESFRQGLARFDFGGLARESHIEMLTIHQAKGLEFDHVFLPALQKRVGRDEAPLLYTETFYQKGAFHFLLAERQGRGGEASSLYRYLHWLETEKSKYETMRLLYVAMTRAKQSLYLSSVGDKVAKGSFLALLQE